MKIIIPMNKQDMEEGICPSFGRAPYFLFYNTDTSGRQWLPNNAAQSSGGAGIGAAQILADKGADALITSRCGENAERVLCRANIMVYQSIDGTAKENIEALVEAKLQVLSEFHAGLHSHGR